MGNIFFKIHTLIVLFFLVGCVTGKPVTQIPANTHIEIHERIVTVEREAPIDSASAEALIKCDSLNQAYVVALEAYEIGNLTQTTDIKTVDAGLQVKWFTRTRDSVIVEYITVSDTLKIIENAEAQRINEDLRIENRRLIKELDDPLTWWQKCRLWLGNALILILAVFFIIMLFKFFVKEKGV
jgi:uncharacterized protein YwlG (UPF0340 family)